MTDHYCSTCYRTLPPGRESCADCERRIVERPRAKLAWLLAGVAGTLLVMGMLTHNSRLTVTAAALAGIGALFLTFRTVRG